MKRSPPSFVVEVRRQRRSTNSDRKSWAVEPALADAALGSGRLAGASALFEPEPKTPPPPASAPPSRPPGRILPSLADIEPVAPPAETATASPRRKRESLGPPRTPKTKPRTNKGADREFAPPSRPSFAGSSARGGATADAGRKTKAPPPVVEPKREIAPTQPPAVRDLAPESAAAAPGEARQARHRRIMDRYVRGAEPKPGQHWKRRPQPGRK
jgi:hypothetical protein